MNYIIRPYNKNEEAYIADAHQRVYAEEYNWGESFIKYATKIATDFPLRKPNDRETLWIAEVSGAPAGGVMLCQTEDPAVGQLRLFIVEKECRGHGIGSALLSTLLDQAKALGYETVILWTASPLKAAIRLYEKFGFSAVEEVENTDWSVNHDLLYEIKMVKDL